MVVKVGSYIALVIWTAGLLLGLGFAVAGEITGATRDFNESHEMRKEIADLQTDIASRPYFEQRLKESYRIQNELLKRSAFQEYAMPERLPRTE